MDMHNQEGSANSDGHTHKNTLISNKAPNNRKRSHFQGPNIIPVLRKKLQVKHFLYKFT